MLIYKLANRCQNLDVEVDIACENIQLHICPHVDFSKENKRREQYVGHFRPNYTKRKLLQVILVKDKKNFYNILINKVYVYII